MNGLPFTQNGLPLKLSDIAILNVEAWRNHIIEGVSLGLRLSCLCTLHKRELLAVLADDSKHRLYVARTRLDEPSYLSLTPECPQAHLFEREIFEESGIEPLGHPWLKPLRHGTEGTEMFKVEGESIHEVAVGPVHAGVIEPGHFRFQCSGETVLHLEIALGYQHRGIEKALLGGPNLRSLKYMETLCGDSSIAHAWAYCRNLEGLCGFTPPERTERVRGVALELERCANHTGDLGALAGDVGFLPTSSFCGRIRGDWLNITAEACGSRLGRDWLRPGGLRFDLDERLASALMAKIEGTWQDTRDAIELLWKSTSVLNRFEAAGSLNAQTAQSIGLVGVAARACGLHLDIRKDHPFGPYENHNLELGLAQAGNVHARAWVRWAELQESHRFLQESMVDLLHTPCELEPAPQLKLPPDALCISMTEGWRGEVLHLALTDKEGRFERYKIVDPSFHNWFGLALALRNEQISDFPLINKSFNLSYCGHDL